MGNPIEKKLKQKFLKQIEAYNDFILQNDLNHDLINVDNDYDFSAFTSAEDWAIESERLSDRLSDRKIEIAQNEDNGEFQGMELEGGSPSYEAVKNMSDEQFAEYEAKYLTSPITEDEPIDVAPSVEVSKVNPVEIDPVVAEANTTDQNITTPVDFNVSSEVTKPLPVKSEYEFSIPLAWELFKGTHPGIQNAIDAVDSVGKVIDQGQPVNALQDGARGVMSGLADTAGSIADLGGLVPNHVADMAHKSADWWRDQYEIVDSESGNVGTKIGSEAVTGLLGGAVGKVAGRTYQGMKRGGEALRKRSIAVAKDREDMAKSHGLSSLEAAITRQKAYENATNVPPRHSYTKALFGDTQPVGGSARIDPVPYGHPMSDKDYLTKALREKNHMDGKYLAGKGSRKIDYSNVFEPSTPRAYPAPARLFDTALHNAKRKLNSRAMLKRNDEEIETMFNQGTPLDDALKISQERWDKIPDTARDAGLVMGLGVAQ